MAGSTEKKLRRVFDFQRFENDEKLGSVIDKAKRFSSARSLSEDELEFAAGGREIVQEDQEPEGFCPKCNRMVAVRIFSGGRYACSKCRTRIDETTIVYPKR